MIQINSLYSLEDVKDYYYVTEDLKIVNINTNYVKKYSKDYQGYPYVTLESNRGSNMKVFVHKIIALAFIENKEYILIEHKDDNVENYSIENLEFGNHSTNGKNAFRTGLHKRKEKIFEVTMKESGDIYTGTIKELVMSTGIPKGTLYDNSYKNRSRKFTIKELTGQSTIESE